jgi:hypothetical protein
MFPLLSFTHTSTLSHSHTHTHSLSLSCSLVSHWCRTELCPWQLAASVCGRFHSGVLGHRAASSLQVSRRSLCFAYPQETPGQSEDAQSACTSSRLSSTHFHPVCSGSHWRDDVDTCSGRPSRFACAYSQPLRVRFVSSCSHRFSGSQPRTSIGHCLQATIFQSFLHQALGVFLVLTGILRYASYEHPQWKMAAGSRVVVSHVCVCFCLFVCFFVVLRERSISCAFP